MAPARVSRSRRWALAAAAAAALLAVAAAVPPRACQPPYNSLPFCNVSLPIAQRVADLLSRLTVQQKVAQTDNTAAAIPSLGIPEYQWWSEALHGVNANCVNGHCPTSFPCALVMGASFDMPLVDSVATAISDEARAMNSAGAKTFLNDYFGLDVWAPNLNVFRDPRWGRGQEVPGECPYLVGQYGAHFVSNLEGAGQSSRYLKLAATMKHFTAYDLEHWEGYDRESFNAIVSQLDLVQTFYPPFQRTVQSGGVHGVMCSYNAVNGVPSCANPFLSQVVRQQWGFQGYITSDCDAIFDICYAHNYTSTPEQAVADALSAGCDLDCGNTYGDHLISALQQGLVNISYLDASLTRLFTLRMQLGLFDPVAGQPYTNYTLDVVDSAQHRALARQAAREGITLLKNQPAAGDAAPLLPLRAPLRIALIGPNANVTDTLCSNYYGELPHVVSVLEGLSAVAGASVTFVHGCDINSTDTSGFPAAVAAAAAADVAVLVLGLDQTIEREGLDRITISLPGVQEQLAQAVFAKQPRTVLVLVNGGPVAIEWEAAELPAIVEAYYPGEEGGNAIADILFGFYNPAGRLPYTVYPADYVDELPLNLMDMRAGPGRTYRFYTGQPIFEFGFGLSYTSFNITFAAPPQPALLAWDAAMREAVVDPSGVDVVATVVNTGKIAGDVSVLGFLEVQSANCPRVQLFDFARVSQLQPGATATVTLNVDPAVLNCADESGQRFLLPGPYRVRLADSLESMTLWLSQEGSGWRDGRLNL